jgi:hypothetical protein
MNLRGRKCTDGLQQSTTAIDVIYFYFLILIFRKEEKAPKLKNLSSSLN